MDKETLHKHCLKTAYVINTSVVRECVRIHLQKTHKQQTWKQMLTPQARLENCDNNTEIMSCMAIFYKKCADFPESYWVLLHTRYTLVNMWGVSLQKGLTPFWIESEIVQSARCFMVRTINHLTLKLIRTSTTPSCSGPILAQKSRDNSVLGVAFSHTMPKMDFRYSHRFSWEKTH